MLHAFSHYRPCERGPPPPVRRVYLAPEPPPAPEPGPVRGGVPLGCARPPALVARLFGTLFLLGFGLPALLRDSV
jgi:hypothetical protein